MGKQTLDEVIAEYKNKLIPIVQSGNYKDAMMGTLAETKKIISLSKSDRIRSDRVLWAGQLVLGASAIEELARLGTRLRLDQVIQGFKMSREGTLRFISDVGPDCGMSLESTSSGDFVVFKDTKMNNVKAVLLNRIQAS